MQPAYDEDGKSKPSFTVSPVPFRVWYGDDIRPTRDESVVVRTYFELRKVLSSQFRIPTQLIPPRRFFKPSRDEKAEEVELIYRTVPEGLGEPEWRSEARHAVMAALDEAEFQGASGVISVEGVHFHSVEELQQGLEKIAERAGGRKLIKGEAYQPDYEEIVKKVLSGNSNLLDFIRLPRKKHRRVY